jgi:DNA-binding NarL/FixJ family response regulator
MNKNKATILIVDDHQLIIDGIKSMLHDESRLNIKFESNDGKQALEMIDENKEELDLIITDVNVPGLSGIELCIEVKKKYPNLKVLILSMYENSSIIKEALLAEADGYIVKNSNKDVFLNAIFRVLDGGTFFSESIIPLIYKELKKENNKKEALSKLSSREIEVLKLIINEQTSEEIASILNISKKTVDNHRQNILTKTNCKSTVGLVKYAINSGLSH